MFRFFGRYIYIHKSPKIVYSPDRILLTPSLPPPPSLRPPLLSVAHQVYADVLFTDVKASTFWNTLPMSLDAFCSHVERRANECLEAMQEFWLSDAAGLVGQYVGPLVSEDWIRELRFNLENRKGECSPDEQAQGLDIYYFLYALRLETSSNLFR